MSMGLVGEKSGMTRIFTEDGESIPVTVVEVSPLKISALKTQKRDGYTAVQVAVGDIHAKRVKKSRAGQFVKAGIEAARHLKEFRVDDCADMKVGDEVTVDLFKEGQSVDVQSVSRGKGFQGPVKRHNFKMQDATHGNSISHRAHGSTGQCQTPGRVLKGKKMAGHMGSRQVSVQNQRVVRVDVDRRIILIRGTIPGAPGAQVIIRPSVKKHNEVVGGAE